MGFRGMSFGSLLIIFLIVLVLFGSKRLREIGTDLGAALRSFRQGMQDDEASKGPNELPQKDVTHVDQ